MKKLQILLVSLCFLLKVKEIQQEIIISSNKVQFQIAYDIDFISHHIFRVRFVTQESQTGIAFQLGIKQELAKAKKQT